jgi:peptidoglycan/xylan/chitin deacetylase (PgdA/CDA1 family)
MGTMADITEPYQWHLRPQIPMRPPSFRSWPGGARMALQVIVLHEWESVPWHRSRPMPPTAHHKFDTMSLGAREYGARHGIWRLLDVLEKYAVKSTVLCNGLTAEFFPDSVRAVVQKGHEVAAHGFDQSIFPPMIVTREEERELLIRTNVILERVGRQKIRGYMSPGPRSTPHTLELLAELGIDWICEYVDSDFPYMMTVNGKTLTAISYATPGLIDFDLMARGPLQALADMKYSFDAAYAEASRHPMKFCYAVHTHWGGTVGMARMLDDFLAHVRSHDGVWCCRHDEMADFWTALVGSGH